MTVSRSGGAGRQRGLPEPGDGIRIEGGIRADEGQLLDHRLRDQHPIERIAVMEWERRDDREMIKPDVEQ
jgi:hypothetical protein